MKALCFLKFQPMKAGSVILCLGGLLSSLTGCSPPAIENPKVLNSYIGKPLIDVVKAFGVPNGNFAVGDHLFLSYLNVQTEYSPGSMGWGWGWGGYYGWDAPYWGWGGADFPPSYYTTACQTTFESVQNRVIAWRLRGDGC